MIVENIKELARTLEMRANRLIKEIEMNAPEIIIKNELLLVKDAYDRINSVLENKKK